MFKKQGTSKRSASTSSCDIKPGFGEATPTDMGSQASACDMAWAREEQELSEEELATVVGGKQVVWGKLWGGMADTLHDISARLERERMQRMQDEIDSW